MLDGQIGEAIQVTYQLFPGILERNPNLLFALKVRQFIEMLANLNSLTSSSSACTSSSDKPTDNLHNSSEPTSTNIGVTNEANVHINGSSASSSNNENGHSNNSNEEEMGKLMPNEYRKVKCVF